MTRTERVQQMAERMAKANLKSQAEWDAHPIHMQSVLIGKMLPLAEMAVWEMAEEAKHAALHVHAQRTGQTTTPLQDFLQSRGLKD